MPTPTPVIFFVEGFSAEAVLWPLEINRWLTSSPLRLVPSVPSLFPALKPVRIKPSWSTTKSIPARPTTRPRRPFKTQPQDLRGPSASLATPKRATTKRNHERLLPRHRCGLDAGASQSRRCGRLPRNSGDVLCHASHGRYPVVCAQTPSLGGGRHGFRCIIRGARWHAREGGVWPDSRANAGTDAGITNAVVQQCTQLVCLVPFVLYHVGSKAGTMPISPVAPAQVGWGVVNMSNIQPMIKHLNGTSTHVPIRPGRCRPLCMQINQEAREAYWGVYPSDERPSQGLEMATQDD